MNIVKVINHLRERLNGEELGLWFVLAFIYEREQEGIETRSTDLVQKLEFGTGPTVHNKIKSLEAWGFIQSAFSENDKRARVLCITDTGLEFMRDLDSSLKEVLWSGDTKGERA